MLKKLITTIAISFALTSPVSASVFCDIAELYEQITCEDLKAVALKETKLGDGNGSVYPYPWSLNVKGKSYRYDTKTEMVDAIKAFQAAGERSVDVGVMQVNTRVHHRRYGSIEQLSDPLHNIMIAAEILNEAMGSTDDVITGLGRYHTWRDKERLLTYGRHVYTIRERLKKK